MTVGEIHIGDTVRVRGHGVMKVVGFYRHADEPGVLGLEAATIQVRSDAGVHVITYDQIEEKLDVQT